MISRVAVRSVRSVATRMPARYLSSEAPSNAFDQLQSKPVEELVKGVDLSPEVEARLNKEFQEALRDFAIEPDLSHDIFKLAERTSAQGPRSVAAPKPGVDATGNVMGHNLYPNVRRTSPQEPYSQQELFLRQRFHSRNSDRLGAKLENVYQPHKDTLQPPTIRETSISTLIAAGAHLGHATGLFRPSTQPFIYGERDGIHIIDLDQTLIYLRRASKVVEGIAEKGGLIVFVGTRPGQQRALQVAANRAGGYYVHSRWVPGTLSNATQISSEWQRMEVDMGDNPTGRELSPNLQKTLVKPDLVVVLNPVENRNCLRECVAAKVPTIGIIDTDSEPSLVSYPIPANDDSLRATDLLLGVLSRSAEKGRLARLHKFKHHQTSMAEKESGDAFNQHL
ncbi:small ribosomal subunit protein uS2m [Trichomonascus vanleenenianus]|uniref:mitochondrial 37S ribosomal protein uS2m MRP4 n=1 Tax=Trichomonascus vanleenenianus TaxID=2268995 RepID=UPI003ECA3244